MDSKNQRSLGLHGEQFQRQRAIFNKWAEKIQKYAGEGKIPSFAFNHQEKLDGYFRVRYLGTLTHIHHSYSPKEEPWTGQIKSYRINEIDNNASPIPLAAVELDKLGNVRIGPDKLPLNLDQDGDTILFALLEATIR